MGMFFDNLSKIRLASTVMVSLPALCRIYAGILIVPSVKIWQAQLHPIVQRLPVEYYVDSYSDNITDLTHPRLIADG